MARDKAPNSLQIGRRLTDQDGNPTRLFGIAYEELWRQVVAGFVIVPCIASTAANLITLTPRLHQEGAASFGTMMTFGFVADATTSGSVTAAITSDTGSIGPLKVYKDVGTLQAGSGDIKSGGLYFVVYNAALDSGAGGLVLIGGKSAALTYLESGLIGTMFPYGKTTAPAGFLLADGSNRSRATYADLFAVYSTTFGVGDGVTTFGTPDGRGRGVFGYDAANATGRLTLSATGGISASTLGNTGGEQAHTQLLAELVAHAHTIDWNLQTNTAGGGVLNRVASIVGASGGTNTNSTTSVGGGSAFNVVSPGIVMNWIIFAGA